ncbi:MOSC domain-containing protein [Kineococcus rubinsiae]|uniref:MOSC domain-containing protein n=1 Tax=Kineococcus rubinsiae TaxID=2609562 RepID=UPI001432212D|nr:MOSC domain-containing protein [Kineococcus rubinsiae]
MSAHVESLWVYPVKGLSPQRLDAVPLRAGEGFPHDRVIALARPGGAYRPGLREPVSKREFFVLVAEERLAGLDTHLEPTTGRFTVRVRDHVVLDADLGDDDGIAAALAFFSRVLDLPPGVRPVHAVEPGRRFTDVAVDSDALMNAVSFLNLASVRDLAERTATTLDPLRFRANVHLDGLPAFAEADLVGREFSVGGVRFRGVQPTARCAATEVEPGTGRRDLPVPQMLVRTYGSDVMGFYAVVVEGGALRPGDRLDTAADARTAVDTVVGAARG